MLDTQIGYASGYSSEFIGDVGFLYREVECQSMGQAACRIVGQPLDVMLQGEDVCERLEINFLSGSGAVGFPRSPWCGEANPPRIVNR